MSSSNRSRRILALIAAYMVALQALLLPLSVAAGAGFDGALCTAASSENPRHPAGNEPGCGCAAGCGMQCCAQALAGPPSAELAPVAVQIGTLAPVPPFDRAPPRGERGPQAARAPPFA